ncbi:MAG: LPP20 family lipoprotein [Treponema sp.]|nr:LPP20 family lipoprotein [Treponema sp.]
MTPLLWVLPILLLCGCGSAGKAKDGPGWISDPYKVYSRTAYIAAVGYAPVRNQAEKNALASLSAIFGQSVSSESSSSYSYSQALEAGKSGWAENADIAQAVKTSVEMDTLIGAEIKDVWNDGTTFYAVAAMERAKAGLIYSELIQTNLRTIDNLTRFSAAEPGSFEDYSRYRKAAQIADANTVLAKVMKLISPGSMAGENLKSGDEYRIEAAEIAKNIPIAVTVENDRQARIQSAFSQALTAGGFRVGGNDARYTLNVLLLLEEISFSGNPNKFIRYTVDADLVDTFTGMVLFPWNINAREGHANAAEAENRALRAAENEIKKSYISALGNSLGNSGGSKK